jgi:hypothetical protein
MREILLNTWVLAGLALIVLATSFCVATVISESHWFSRAGAVTTILGLLLTIKHNVLSSSRDIHVVVMEKCHYANWAPDRSSPSYQKDMEMARRVMKDEYIGLILTVVGTIVWAYGDFIHGFVI